MQQLALQRSQRWKRAASDNDNPTINIHDTTSSIHDHDYDIDEYEYEHIDEQPDDGAGENGELSHHIVPGGTGSANNLQPGAVLPEGYQARPESTKGGTRDSSAEDAAGHHDTGPYGSGHYQGAQEEDESIR